MSYRTNSAIKTKYDYILLNIYLISIFIPFITRKIGGLVTMVLLLLSFVFSASRYKGLLLKRIGALISVFALCIYVVLRYLLTPINGRSAFGNASIYFIYALVLVLQIVVLESYNKKELLGFAKTIYICVIFTAVTSFLSLCIDIDASKIVTGMGTDTVFYKWHNVADYLYSLVLGVFSIFSLYLYQQSKSRNNRNLWYLAAFFFLLIVTVMCNSLISIIMTVFALMIYLILNMKNKNIRTGIFIAFIIFITLFLIGVIAFPDFLYKICVSIADAIPFGNISYRIKELAESIFISGNFSFTGRTDLWQASFDSIRSNLFFGVGFWVGRDKLSAHSQIFDDIAKLGLAGYALMIVIFVISMKPVLKFKKTKAFNVYVSVLLAAMLFSIFNLSMSVELLITLMILIPIMAEYETSSEILYEVEITRGKYRKKVYDL